MSECISGGNKNEKSGVIQDESLHPKTDYMNDDQTLVQYPQRQ